MTNILEFLGNFADRLSARTFMFLVAASYWLMTTDLIPESLVTLRVGAVCFLATLLVVRASIEDAREVKTPQLNGNAE